MRIKSGETGGIIKSYEDSLNDFWRQLTDVFDDEDLNEERNSFFQKLCHIFLRLCAFGIMVTWVIVGFFTLGLLWPQQVRSRLFESKLNPGSYQSAEERTKNIVDLVKEVDDYKFDLITDGASLQDLAAIAEAQLEDLKNDFSEQMKEIQQLVNALIHLQISTN